MSLADDFLGAEETQQNPFGLVNIHSLSDRDAWTYSDEEIIAAALGNWPSKVYDHYNIFLQRYHTEEGDPDYMEFRFECKFGSRLHQNLCRARKTKSYSGSLWSSAGRCDQRRELDADTGVTSSIEPSRETKDLASRCIKCSLYLIPPHLINSRLVIPRHLNGDLYDASAPPLSITDNLPKIHSSLAVIASRYFQTVSGAIHLIVDGWTNHTPINSLVCAAIVWQEADKTFRSVLDVAWISDLCSESYLTNFISQCLERFGLIGKIKSICISNAPQSEQLVKGLHARHSSLSPDVRTLCYPHIVGLMAETFISFLRPLPRITPMKFYEFPLEEEIENDAEISDQPLDFYLSEREYNTELIQEAVREARRKEKMLGICVGSGTLQGARQIMNKATTLEQIIGHIDSQEVKENYWGHGEQDDLSPQANIQAGRPRALGQWNTICDSIDRYLRFQPTLHNLVAAGNLPGLDECCLDEAQQKLLEDFNMCLEAFKQLVDIFSRQEIPFLHEVLVELFILRMLLDDIRNDRLGTHLAPLARVAAEAALSAYNLIDKDDTLPEIYIMVIVMRPTHKLQWFKDRGMNTSRIQALVNEYFDENYPPMKRESDEEGLFDLKQALQTDNMRIYLSSPVLSEESIKERGGLLRYWNHELKTCPRVARMALDHLTIPASSMDPTRTFPGGPISTNGLEKHVNHSTFRAMMSIRSWWGTPVLPDINAVANILDDVSEA